jgi:hypothetical protein
LETGPRSHHLNNLLAILGGFFVDAQALMFCNMADNLAHLAKPRYAPPAQFSQTE